MSKELELKTCPFCGQYAMMDPDIDPRDACTCDGALVMVHRAGAPAAESTKHG